MKPNLHYPVCRFALLILLASVLLSCSGKKETASVILLGKEWQIKSSLKTEKGGEELSAAGVEEPGWYLSLIHISEPTRLLSISYAVFCLQKKTHTHNNTHDN